MGPDSCSTDNSVHNEKIAGIGKKLNKEKRSLTVETDLTHYLATEH